MAFDGPPAPVAPAVVSRDADGRVTVRAVRLAAPLRIDGALDESADGSSHRGQLDYNSDRYGVQFDRLRVGAHFNPEVGFVRRSDIRRTLGELRFNPRPRRLSAVRRYWWMGSVDYVKNGPGRVDSRERSGEFALEFQNGDRFSVLYTNTHEFIPRPFTIASNVTLPVGGHAWEPLRVGYNLGQQRRVLAGVAVEYGTFYNGHRTAFSASRGRVSLTPQFSLEPTYSLNRVDLAQSAFTSHLAGSRVTYAMSPRMFASALLQYNPASNAMSASVRLRWEYRPGSEFFVVYNDERDTRASGFPDLATRAFIVKTTGCSGSDTATRALAGPLRGTRPTYRGVCRVRFAEPALRTVAWFGVRRPGSAKRTRQAYSTIVSCELENENGWKIVVRPKASFALTV